MLETRNIEIYYGKIMVVRGLSLTVEEGQILARLDISNIQANLSLAEAQLRVAQTAVQETKVRLDEAQIELGRTASLVKDGISTAAELDAARAEAGSAA